MENKKLMIPIILGVLLLCGIIFTVVYKKTSGTNPNDIQEEQTLAPKETEPIETKIVGEDNQGLDDFDINEKLANVETKVSVMIDAADYIEDFEEKKESLGILSESSNSSDEESIEETTEYELSEEQKIAATSEVSEEMNQGLEDGIREYTRKQAEQWYNEVLEANGGEIPWKTKEVCIKIIDRSFTIIQHTI